jgi:hypothetical protein
MGQKRKERSPGAPEPEPPPRGTLEYVLWHNIRVLMEAAPVGYRSPSTFAKFCGTGTSAIESMQAGRAVVGIPVLRKIGAPFGLQPWQLLATPLTQLDLLVPPKLLTPEVVAQLAGLNRRPPRRDNDNDTDAGEDSTNAHRVEVWLVPAPHLHPHPDPHPETQPHTNAHLHPHTPLHPPGDKPRRE